MNSLFELNLIRFFINIFLSFFKTYSVEIIYVFLVKINFKSIGDC